MNITIKLFTLIFLDFLENFKVEAIFKAKIFWKFHSSTVIFIQITALTTSLSSGSVIKGNNVVGVGLECQEVPL